MRTRGFGVLEVARLVLSVVCPRGKNSAIPPNHRLSELRKTAEDTVQRIDQDNSAQENQDECVGPDL